MGNLPASERYTYPSAGTWEVTQGPVEPIPPPERSPTSPADVQQWLRPEELHALGDVERAVLDAFDTQTMEDLINQLTLQTVGTITEEKDLASILALVNGQTDSATEGVRLLYEDRILDEGSLVTYFLQATRCKLHVLLNPQQASVYLRFAWAQTSGVINLTNRTIQYGDATNIPRMARPFHASMNDVIRAVNEGKHQPDFYAYMIARFTGWTNEVSRQDMMQFNHWHMSRAQGFIK